MAGLVPAMTAERRKDVEPGPKPGMTGRREDVDAPLAIAAYPPLLLLPTPHSPFAIRHSPPHALTTPPYSASTPTAPAAASGRALGSIEMLSGERMNAMLPSRGGRLIVTPRP